MQSSVAELANMVRESKINGGGAAAAQSGTVAGQTTAADMVKRRADEDGDGQEAGSKIRGYKARRELSEEERAAAKIQAGFRGYKVRKGMKTGVSESSGGGGGGSAGSVEEAAAATKIQAGVRGFLVRRRNLKEEKAATKIQAGFRGYHTRKQLPADQYSEASGLGWLMKLNTQTSTVLSTVTIKEG